VETLNKCDGYPIVQVNVKLQALLDGAGIETLHVSMTIEGDFDMAIVEASSGS
jgi:phosphopantetheinyl transferase (holo-ACP synthase)